MADYLLDTNILKYWYDPRCAEHTNVLARIKSTRTPAPESGYVSRLFISVVTRGEIKYGHRVVLKPDAATQAAYEKFVREQCPEPLELTAHEAEQYGDLRAWLFNNFSPKTKRSNARRVEELVDPTTARELGVQENDLWIAAQAMTLNLTLVTHDSRGNFGKLLEAYRSTLRVEDWTKGQSEESGTTS
jgi:tRNA(fMet)-specific endonuclease VapC